MWGVCDYDHNVNMRLSVLLTLTVPKVVTLGEKVAPFSLPPEARPADPVRREVFRQQAVARTAWFEPQQVPLTIGPLPLPCPSHSAGPVPEPAKKRRRRQ